MTKKGHTTLTRCYSDVASCIQIGSSRMDFGWSAPCCTASSGSCEKLSRNSFQCPANSFRDSRKGGITAGSTLAEQQSNCCTLRANCTNFTCPAGYDTKTGIAYCGAPYYFGTNDDGCDKSTCCTAKTRACARLSDYTTCETGTYKDPAKWGVLTSTGRSQRQAACCTQSPNCSAYTGICPAGYTHNVTKPCLGKRDGIPCRKQDCCTPIPGTCAAFPFLDCPRIFSNTKHLRYFNVSEGITGDTASTCCKARATCDEFFNDGQASATPTPTVSTASTSRGSSIVTVTITYSGYTYSATTATNFGDLVCCAFAKVLSDAMSSQTTDFCTASSGPTFTYANGVSATCQTAAARRGGSTVQAGITVSDSVQTQGSLRAAGIAIGTSVSTVNSAVNTMHTRSGLGFSTSMYTASSMTRPDAAPVATTSPAPVTSMPLLMGSLVALVGALAMC